ncbi:PQQ-dependent sugar dehydrogenase [Luteolibacter sp. LG18]|uniref:PQQ-dependent sugar dehydrogenase n=1 Tax=Luteolibacter sp. LG18 TaxID=2819286 RepID=UPI002B2F5E71|nr:hypothetical protein llg_23760 [Luteolibacter sp. LG18]
MLSPRILALVAGVTAHVMGGQLPSGSPYIESSGIAQGQAEDYHALRPSISGGTWAEANSGLASPAGGAFLRVAEARKAAATWQAGAAVDYKIRIATPGVYRLWLRWSGTNTSSDALYAGIVELADGSGGRPDYYEDSGHTASSFANPGWDGHGQAEAAVTNAAQNPMLFTLGAGDITLRVVCREDGVALDEWRLQLAVLPPPGGNGLAGNLAVIGLEDFSYPDGALAGKNGGQFFDVDVSAANEPFIGHDGTRSAWLKATGAPAIQAGRLVTNNGSIRRPFNGPSTGKGSEEEAGTIASGSAANVFYFRVRMNRSTKATWSGVSACALGTEKILFGVPKSMQATNTLGIEETGAGSSTGIVTVPDATDHDLVGKYDASSRLATLWLDPDFSQPEQANIPVVVRTIGASLSITSLKIGSGGQATWDNLRVTTVWNALSDGEPEARGDLLAMHRGQKVKLDVLANDLGAFNAQGVTILSRPSAGAATVQEDGTVLYVHNGGPAGPDAFTYRAPSLVPGVFSDAQVTLDITETLRVASPTITIPTEPPSAAYAVVPAFTGVSFYHPVSLMRVPGDARRLFVAERGGRIWLIPDVTATSPARQLYLDVAAALNGRANEQFDEGILETGVKSIALHPDFLRNGRIFVTYCPLVGGVKQVRMSSFQSTAGNLWAGDPASEKVFLTQNNDGHNDHNIDCLAFGPDGYLYLSCGDQGPQYDGSNNSQLIDKNLWSGIFRFDVDRKPGSVEPNAHPSVAIDPATGKARYAIPPDNPFIGATSFNGKAVNPASVRTEFYALGFRNPWRMSFDSVTGELWMGDVGQDTIEEVNRIVKGGNYQWGFKEGLLDGPKTAPAGGGGIPPVYYYYHGSGTFQGNSITGGYFLHGGRYPQLEGRYIFADYVSGHIWTLKQNAGAAPTVERIAGKSGLACFEADPSNGDVLMLSFDDGQIHRLKQTPDATTFPDRLSKTGLFAELTGLSPNPGILPYEVNLTFWSDHARKRRWFSLPDGVTSAGFQAEGPWTFPTGAVWVKHFDMDLVRGDPSTAKRLETRVLVKTAAGAYGVSYQWNDAGTEAFLVPDGGASIPLQINDGGVIRAQTWSIPSRGQCVTCHSPVAGNVLSFNTRQLNHSGEIAGLQGNFLTLLDAGGFIDPISPGTYPRHYAPAESAYSLELRARSWLAVNCSYCHQPGGSGAGLFDLRAATDLFQTGILDGIVSGVASDPADRLIVRGDPVHSVILSRMGGTNGYGRMPPLATSVVDQAGLDVVRDWILQELPTRQSFAEWSGGEEEGLVTRSVSSGSDEHRFAFLTHGDPRNPAVRWNASLAAHGAGLRLSWPNLPDRSIRAWVSSDLKHWEPWDVPGNDGIPRAGTGPRVFEVSAADGARFFRCTIEE